MGVREDGRDSIAVQLAPSYHWPELRVLICVASDSRKKTSSSVGMKNSVETSPLLKFRAEHCVPMRTREMIQAIQVWGKNKLTLTRRKHVCRVKAFFSRIRLVNLPTLTE